MLVQRVSRKHTSAWFAVVVLLICIVAFISYLGETDNGPPLQLEIPMRRQGSSGSHRSKDIVGKASIERVERDFETLEQTDPDLIQYVRARYLTPPSEEPYALDEPNRDATDFAVWVRKLFRGTKNGIFIEAGANEGERHSHTLALEQYDGWTGLLVECNPLVSPYLLSKNRKAWVASVCISPTTTPSKLKLNFPPHWTYSGRLGLPAWDIPSQPGNWTSLMVESVPLYSIIAAAGFEEIDYFSFDVEGLELSIFKAFPFDKIKIKVIILEVYFYTTEEKVELEDFLGQKGYKAVQKWGTTDQAYVLRSLL